MLAPRRDGDRFWYPITQHPLARVLKFDNFRRYLATLPRGGAVLDYGSGDRPYEQLLLTRFERYVAADYEVTNRGHSGRPDVWIRDGHVDLPSGSVACVVLTEVLEHVYDPRAVIAECHRLLQPGGHVMGSVPFARGEHEAPHDFYRYTSFALRRLFTDGGFVVREVDYVGHLAAVAACAFADTLGLVNKALHRVGLGLIGRLFMLLVRIPEFVCYGLNATALDPQRVAYLRHYPLGFTFLAQKPGAGSDARVDESSSPGIVQAREVPRFEPGRRVVRRLRRALGNAVGVVLGPVPHPDKWLFVVGCYDSGTTLLSRILATHPDIGSMRDEGQYNTSELVRPADAGFPRLWALRPELFHLDEGSRPRLNVERLKRQWGFRFNDPGRPVLMEKTPANAARVRWLEREFENAHFVAIIRDGFAVAEGIRRKAGHPLQRAARQWAVSNRIMLDDLAHVQHALIIRYEDLVERPADVIGQVLAFIGLDAAGVMLDGRAWKVHEYQAQIANFNAQARARLSAADMAVIRAEAGDMLRQLGYD